MLRGYEGGVLGASTPPSYPIRSIRPPIRRMWYEGGAGILAIRQGATSGAVAPCQDNMLLS